MTPIIFISFRFSSTKNFDLNPMNMPKEKTHSYVREALKSLTYVHVFLI